MIKVKATREGLVGGTTASGYIVDKIYPFVALPSTKALHKWVYLYNPLNNKHCYAQVLDVGPFNEHDDAYVFQPITLGGTIDPIRPLSESQMVGGDNVKSNGAGIDLGEKVWELLGMKDNTEIKWKFASEETI